MQSAEEKDHIVIKLDDGEDVFKALGIVIEKHGIDSALILSGIGMLKDFEIGYYNGKNYIIERFVDPMELLSMHGSIAKGKENRIHIHISLANSEHKVFGGHLMSAKVCVLNEIVILRMNEMDLTRKLNPKSGLMELEVSEGKKG
jgi:predicted DNA-binding protein with PD1-like motif